MASWPTPSAPVFAKPDALEWALRHVESFGDTIFLPHAFEYAAIRHEWSSLKCWLMSQDLRTWSPRPLRRFLAKKTKHSFRYVTQLDPLEYLLFTSLIYEVGPQLEGKRIEPSDNIVFSWRFATDASGQMYDPSYRWNDFNKQCLELANAATARWVVVADIADFFPHIYIHPVENALSKATGRSPAAYCILRMISNWNAFVSYGLPVGLAGSRILAESTIVDLDESLIGAGYKHCRYSDDIRVFCKSEGEARRALEHVASHLFETHGLTLQPTKTLVVKKEEYVNRFAVSGERTEIESLTSKLQDLLEEAGWEDEYEEEIEYDNLPESTRDEIDKLNLLEVLQEQLESDQLDPIIMSFLLHRMKQLGISDAAKPVLRNLDKLFPVVDSVVRYLESLRKLNERSRKALGRAVLATARKPTTGSYERACLLSLFTHNREFDNETAFEQMYEKFPDPTARRELMLALGHAHKEHWFQARRREIAQLEPWSRRAFIAGYSCVPNEQRTPLYRSLRSGADVLEKAVIKWAAENPF